MKNGNDVEFHVVLQENRSQEVALRLSVALCMLLPLKSRDDKNIQVIINGRRRLEISPDTAPSPLDK